MFRGMSAAALAMLFASTTLHAQDVAKLGWMSGHWVQKNDKEEVQESWLGPRGNTMVATNLTTTAGRGPTFEFLRIGVKDGRIVYFAMPGGRPATEFPLQAMTESSVVFENPSHDYPTRIIYRKDGDALIARVEGKRRGADASEEWRFERMR
jgi:uncharacterized protein DUF6265